MDNIAGAKTDFIISQPFFATVLLSMKIVQDDTVKTLATDGKTIKYNKNFVDNLEYQEVVFALGHETLHGVYGHSTRRDGRDPETWNQAADYVINEVLVTERIGKPIKGILLDGTLVRAGKGTTEGVYEILFKKKQQDQAKQNQSGQGKPQDSKAGNSPGQGTPQPGTMPRPGEALDEVTDAGKDESEISQAESDMRQTVLQAVKAAKKAGKFPKSIQRIVEEVTTVKADWRSVLRRFLSERTKTEYSYAKPKRRTIGEDYMLPGMTGEKLGAIVVAVDCSGSISPKTLANFAAEIKAIVEDVKPSMLHVLYFDSVVSHCDSYTPDDDIKISAHGGGGTRFSPIFDCIDAREFNPVACVVLTDLECSDFGSEPGYPVLWASTGSTYAPFGEVLKL